MCRRVTISIYILYMCRRVTISIYIYCICVDV